MRLVVKKQGETINEFEFKNGPIHIGRHADSQILLSDRRISRHHAVIYNTQNGTWTLEDLQATNKTYLNDEPIEKTEIKTGDCIRLADYTVEVYMNGAAAKDESIHLDDTLTKTAYNIETRALKTLQNRDVIIRTLDSEHAIDIKLPSKRIKQFAQATEMICRTNGQDQVLHVLLQIAIRQFDAWHVWCALRNFPEGPMTCHAGKQSNGTMVKLESLKLKDKITECIENKHFMLLQRMPEEQHHKRSLQSALIVPIVNESGCFGVIYIDNDLAHPHYDLSDLDYLMLLAIHTSVIIENF